MTYTNCANHPAFRSERLSDVRTTTPDCESCRRWVMALDTVDKAAPGLGPGFGPDDLDSARIDRLAAQLSKPRSSSPRRRLAFAAAAASLLLVAAVPILRDSGEQPRLEVVAAATEDASTARLDIDGQLDLGPARLELSGTGLVAFPDRLKLDLSVTLPQPVLGGLIPGSIELVCVGDETTRRIDGGPWQNTTTGGLMLTSALEALISDPAEILTLLRTSELISDPGREIVDGATVDTFTFDATELLSPVDEPLIPLPFGSARNLTATITIAADEDSGLLRRWQVSATNEGATVLDIVIEFRDHGAPVKIELPD